jgi:dTMP kinase
MNAPFPAPDVVLYLRVTAEVAGRRRAGRAHDPELYEVDAFQRLVAQGYDAAAHWRPDDPIVTIDGEADVETIHLACRRAVMAMAASMEDPCP